MAYGNVTLSELDRHIVDLNRPLDIPKSVISFFAKWKENKGCMPTGISHIPGKGRYIISPALEGKGIIKHFSESEI